jgi:hypothetical protein
MKNLILAFSFSLSFASIIQAQVIKPQAQYFTKVGDLASFQWAPERYESSFLYDVFYYIPEKLKDQSNVSALIFNHGGGASTMDRDGSIAAVHLYVGTLMKLADELGIIVVLPSANGLNWGAHTRGILKDLARVMRKELNVDVDRLGVSGHSMGGMGINRQYLWLADEFAFFLPMSSGIDEAMQTEQHLNKVFNVPYVQIQGTRDHFPVFVTRAQEQLKRTKELEVKYKETSKLKVIFFEGGHNMDDDLSKSTLQDLITNYPRDLYQKELWGTLSTAKLKLTENNITFDYDSEARYFWVELMNTDLSQPEATNFHAKVVGNNIVIEMPVMPKMSKTLRVYLHSKIIDLSRSIEVIINGNVVAKRASAAGHLRNMDTNDAGFNFEDVIDINL